jgi:hypothetical protein
MPRVGFKTNDASVQGAETLRALDHTAIVTDFIHTVDNKCLSHHD